MPAEADLGWGLPVLCLGSREIRVGGRGHPEKHTPGEAHPRGSQ